MVRTGTTCSLIRDVIDCKLEGAFVVGPVNHPQLHSEVVFREELVLVTSPSLRRVEDVAAALNLKTVVFRLGCSYRQRLDTLLASLGALAPEPLEFGSIEAIIACVSAGVGVTLLPRAWLPMRPARGWWPCTNCPRSWLKSRRCSCGASMATVPAHWPPSCTACVLMGFPLPWRRSTLQRINP